MSDQDEQIKRLIRDALSDAFKLQVATLYKIWLSNPSDLEAARTRAAKGLDTAIKTYRIAVDALENRES
jgi:hypothetical protein